MLESREPLTEKLMNTKLISILSALSIPYEQIEHPPVYTSEQARRLVPKQSASSAKNLFLKDKKSRNFYLLVFDDQKKLNIKELSKQIGSTRLSLASPEQLDQLLEVEPGAVSLLALVNDPDQVVQLLFDRELWETNSLQCHPLVNTETLVIPMRAVRRFLEYVGHKVRLVDLP
jgi:Ala-tRNA(Pro) deacylase